MLKNPLNPFRRISIALALLGAALLPVAACTTEPLDPPPAQMAPSGAAELAPLDPQAGRLVTQNIYQGGAGQKILIGVFVYDRELRTPVAPASAEDGTVRWMPIEDWVPSATPPEPSEHSSALQLWVDSRCQVGFAITPQLSRPRFVWQPTGPRGDIYIVWRIGDEQGHSDEVTYQPMWTSSSGSCQPISHTDQEQQLDGRVAWTLGERIPPERFERTEFSAEMSSGSPTQFAPSLRLARTVKKPRPKTAAPICKACSQSDVKACGGVPSLCDCSSGRCCCR